MRANVGGCVYKDETGFRLSEVDDSSFIEDLKAKGDLPEAVDGYITVFDALELCTGTAVSLKAMVYQFLKCVLCGLLACDCAY